MPSVESPLMLFAFTCGVLQVHCLRRSFQVIDRFRFPKQLISVTYESPFSTAKFDPRGRVAVYAVEREVTRLITAKVGINESLLAF